MRRANSAREDIDLALTSARQLGFAVERMQAEHTERHRRRIARAQRKARSRSRTAHARARPHLECLRGSARRVEFRRLLPQHEPGLEQAPRLDRGRAQDHACRPVAPSRRCREIRGWPRAARRRRSHRAHGKSLPPQGRHVALAAMDHDRERRAHLRRRPPRHRREGAGRGAGARRTAGRASAEDGGDRPTDRRRRPRLQQSC